jgi:hypothetical protein
MEITNRKSTAVKQSRLTKTVRNQVKAALAGAICLLGVQGAFGQSGNANTQDFVAPSVFQAAGPDAASIQSTVDSYRTALGITNNANNPGPLGSGRREINWDGGGSSATSPGPTPFTVFLITRGANITTPGTGFVQAPPSGMATTFGNPTYANIFKTFSPLRLFSPIASNVTEVEFFVPGTGNVPATVSGFGSVLTDVDQPNGSGPAAKRGNRHASTLFEFFGTDGKLLFSSFAPSSPGDGRLSFFGVKFNDARIARVRITAGNTAPGPNDDDKADVVMMDDFIYGEPTPLQ